MLLDSIIKSKPFENVHHIRNAVAELLLTKAGVRVLKVEVPGYS